MNDATVVLQKIEFTPSEVRFYLLTDVLAKMSAPPLPFPTPLPTPPDSDARMLNFVVRNSETWEFSVILK